MVVFYTFSVVVVVDGGEGVDAGKRGEGEAVEGQSDVGGEELLMGVREWM